MKQSTEPRQSYSYTGKEFPRTEKYYDFYDEKPALKGFLQYLVRHGTVVSGNMRREFARHAERKHGEMVGKKYEKIISFLEEKGFVASGEREYMLTKKGKDVIHAVEKGDSSCASDFFYILKNLYSLHIDTKKIPVDYYEPVKHFRILGEVESDAPYYIGKADVYNYFMEELSKKGLIQIFIPSENGMIEYRL